MIAACGRIAFDPFGVGSGGDGGVHPGNDGQPVHNVVFATSTTYVPGQLGDLATADSACQARATAGAIGGSFVAWVSTSTTNARDRLGAARGWVRLDGLPFADTVADIVAGNVLYPIAYDDRGDLYAQTVYTFTATRADGTVDAAMSCGDLGSTAGLGTGGSPLSELYWTDHDAQPCSYQAQLYCFEIDRAGPIPALPAIQKYAFVTKGGWLPGAGLGDADILCNNEAVAAGLPPTFRALLATSTASAGSRFSGSQWSRTDGVVVAYDLSTFVAPLELAADGTLQSLGPVWTGADGGSQLGLPNATCMDWTVADVSHAGAWGTPAYAGGNGWFSSNQACNQTGQLYCLQY